MILSIRNEIEKQQKIIKFIIIIIELNKKGVSLGLLT